MLSIKIFSLIFAMINLYSLFITALWILLKQNGLKKQIFIIFEFLWNLCQELWSSSTGWLRLRVFHEVAVKMFTGGVVIWKLECGWRTPIQDGLWLMEKKPQFLTGCQETSVLPHTKLFIGLLEYPHDQSKRERAWQKPQCLLGLSLKSHAASFPWYLSSYASWPFSVWEGPPRAYRIMKIILEATTTPVKSLFLVSDLKIWKYTEIKLTCLKW